MAAFAGRSVSLISLLVLGAIGLASGCDNPRDIAPLRGGLAACDELIAYCEAPAAAFGEPHQSCLDTGLEQLGNACLHAYDDCIRACKTAGDELGGAGGEGGASGALGHGGVGGAS
jgi:hypothetical protein